MIRGSAGHTAHPSLPRRAGIELMARSDTHNALDKTRRPLLSREAHAPLDAGNAPALPGKSELHIWKLALEKSLQPFGTYAIGQGRRMTISSDLVGGTIFKCIIEYFGPSSAELSHYLVVGPVG